MLLQSFLLVILVIFLCLDVNATKPPNEVHSSNAETKIIGGIPIAITTAPYQVSIRKKATEKKNGFGYGHVCGGSVVSQRLIITASHCVYNDEFKPPVLLREIDFTIVMGTADLFHANSNTLQYDVLELIPHPAYNASTFENDIAAMFINGFIPWNWSTVSAVPLNTQALPAGLMTTVTGWGVTNNGLASSRLMAAYVPIIAHDTCVQTYRSYRISADMICAGYMNIGGIDACQGDSGGPLMSNGVLIGVVSWGVSCALPQYPGVYSNISYNYDWIRAINSSFNYTHYGGGAIGVRQNAPMVVSTTIIMTIVCSFIKTF